MNKADRGSAILGFIIAPIRLCPVNPNLDSDLAKHYKCKQIGAFAVERTHTDRVVRPPDVPQVGKLGVLVPCQLSLTKGRRR